MRQRKHGERKESRVLPRVQSTNVLEQKIPLLGVYLMG